MLVATTLLFVVTACSTKKNTAGSRWWHSFNARYNTYYNGSLAFIDGAEEQERGNKDNFTEMIPFTMVGNKATREIGKSNFDRAIEKSEKTIKQHSIKRRPEWTKSRRKTAKDIEWLSRREYNPFLWKAWLLMGKSQYLKGQFDEAAATFSYMSRLYATQPAINGIARSWLARSYTELDWLYDAEDVLTKMRRDTIHYRARTDWDYAQAAFYVRSHRYEEAVPALARVIKYERRRKQRARQWFLMGQIETELGHREQAYRAYKKVIRLNPPYELEFNARIAQTEVMAAGRSRQMIRRLRRMAASDNNKDYLDQVYYAIGNIYLAERDTAAAIGAYETGNKKATRNGIEKGVLLLHLGNLYWAKERYNDAQRCYGEAIGLLDKERDDYEELSERSKVLDELVPYTDAVHLQDSLQVLAKLPEKERNEAIDRVIEALKKKEREEKRAAQEAEAEKTIQQQSAQGNRNNTPKPPMPTPGGQQGLWYFYNPQAVSQGKAAFQRQWGKRENVDDWQRVNRTVVNLNPADSDAGEGEEPTDSIAAAVGEGGEVATDTLATDTAAADPHTREYYLAQIPFTDEQKVESDNIIKDGLFHSGVIFKDKLDNLPLSEKALTRLTEQYPDYEQTDEAWYHLFLLYSRMGRHDIAARCLERLRLDHAESQWTTLLSDPHFAENARFGVHIEDSLYAATYDAFKADRYDEVKTNTQLSADRFPLGANRPKFIFIEGLNRLNEGDATACVTAMKEVVEKYPESEVTEMAGMIIKGVQAGRALYGGKFDIGDIWSRRGVAMEADSTTTDTLSAERNTGFVFLLAYRADSLDANQLLFEMAKYNFSNFMVRNFDITLDQDQGISRMLISGFLNYDEALQYARRLYADEAMAVRLNGCRRIIISENNLKMLGTRYSYVDYEEFFERSFVPLEISDEELLNIPEAVEIPKEESVTDDGSAPAGNAPSTPQMDDMNDLGLPPAPVGNAPSTPRTDDMNDLGLPPAPVGNAPSTPQTDDMNDLGLPPAPVGNALSTPQTDDMNDLGLPPAPAGNAPSTSQTDDMDDLGLPQNIGGANNNTNNEPPADVFDFDEDFYR
ncbi:MAG: tetratricopeptide repeat protein [Prevotella sp.]|nr:tetratricopeptide repeat protein [Prevotella sp.]